MQWRGFYLAFLFFKNCVIVHGVSQRAKLGVASSAMASKGKSVNEDGKCFDQIFLAFYFLP